MTLSGRRPATRPSVSHVKAPRAKEGRARNRRCGCAPITGIVRSDKGPKGGGAAERGRERERERERKEHVPRSELRKAENPKSFEETQLA
jgi:hypothetical protein